MFSEPDDPVVRRRMHAAFIEATARLECALPADPVWAWGHGGRTLGAAVVADPDRAWLRLLEAPEGRQGGKLWTGTERAATALPDDIPRPRLLGMVEWIDDGHAYRAELARYVAVPVCSPSPDLTGPIDLPDAWWYVLRSAVDALTATAVPDGSPPVITQDYVHRAVPRYVGDIGVDTTVRRWSLAHGDLHWANLTGPEPIILDWEGFGPAPYGFDAAHLHAYTLPVPDLAARVREVFDDVLTTGEGRLAELVVAAMLLQAAERDPVHARLAPLVRADIRKLASTHEEPAG